MSKTNFMKDLTEQIWESVKDHMENYGDFDAKMKKSDIRIQRKGIYIMVPRGETVTKTNALYIGKAMGVGGIGARLKNHHRSLNEPDWRVEKTGKTFRTKNIDPFIPMTVYYLKAEDFGITNSLLAEMIEEALQYHLKPKAFDER